MDYNVGATIYLMFTTRQFSDGVPTVLAGSPVVSAYENQSLTQITAGITLGVDHDGVVGLNLLTIVATRANGYDPGKYINMVITTGTVGGVSVVGEVVGTFSLSRSAAVGLLEIDAGTSPAATTLTLKSGSLAEPGDVVHILSSGNGVRGTRIINAFNSGTEVATFKAVWETTPTLPITYALFVSPLAESVNVGSVDPDVNDATAQADSAVDEVAVAVRAEMDSNSTKLALLVNPAGFKKNTLVEDFTFPMRDTTGALLTGLTITGQIAKDDGAYAAITSAITEKGTTGTYRMTASPALLAAEMNADHIVLLFTAPGAVAAMVNIYTEP